MPTLYKTATLNRNTGSISYSDPVEVSKEDFKLLAAPLVKSFIDINDLEKSIQEIKRFAGNEEKPE